MAAKAGACPASLNGDTASRAQTSAGALAAAAGCARARPLLSRSTAPGISSIGSAGTTSWKARASGVAKKRPSAAVVSLASQRAKPSGAPPVAA